MATNDIMLSWLKDAYAMENAIVTKLENHLGDIQENHVMNEKFPEMKVKLKEHIEKTKQHAEKVKGCTERLGGDTSTLKSGSARFMGMLQETGMGMAKDELVKNVLADYATEHMEIASYTSLVAAAEELGDQATVRVCEEILDEEREMAAWVEIQIPMVTQEFLRNQT